MYGSAGIGAAWFECVVYYSICFKRLSWAFTEDEFISDMVPSVDRALHRAWHTGDDINTILVIAVLYFSYGISRTLEEVLM